MKETLQRIAGLCGYSVHQHGTVKRLERELAQSAEEISLRDARIAKMQTALNALAPQLDDSYAIRDEFLQATQFSTAAIQKLLDDFTFETVLDIGAGALEHSEVFARHGKKVTAIDFGVSVYHRKRRLSSGHEIDLILGDFNNVMIGEEFDCVWASHILEHQPNVAQFLEKVLSHAKEGGIVAITVPPLKHEIVGGHISLWNAGMVLVRLVLAGIDCSDASILSYGYNISVIARKNSIGPIEGIEYDRGDIRRMVQYLPRGLRFNSNDLDDPFDGNIARLNW